MTNPRRLPFACCGHCGCLLGDRIGHDDTCRICQNPCGTPRENCNDHRPQPERTT